MPFDVSEFNALMTRYSQALAAEEVLRKAVERAGLDGQIPLDPRLQSAWCERHRVTEGLFLAIEAMMRAGIAKGS